jgi:hypothetical protein
MPTTHNPSRAPIGECPLLTLDNDCLGVVLGFLGTRDWIQFSYTCRELNAFKYVKALMIHKQRTLRTDLTCRSTVLKYMTAAKGTLFNVSFGRKDTEFDEQCVPPAIELVDDSLFAPLEGTIRTLDMKYCFYVTTRAFRHLHGIEMLAMTKCRQITNPAFAYLSSIRVLIMDSCPRITDAAFALVPRCIIASMIACNSLTVDVLEHLRGAHYVCMDPYSLRGCDREAIADKYNINTLAVMWVGAHRVACYHKRGAVLSRHLVERKPPSVAECHLLRLDNDCMGVVLGFLGTRDWIQFSYTCKAVNAFKYVKPLMIRKRRTLRKIMDQEDLLRSLNAAKGTLFHVSYSRARMSGTIPFPQAIRMVDDDLFPPLEGTIHTLVMDHCVHVSDAAFKHLHGIRKLDMSECKQITDAAFVHLKGVRTLCLQNCPEITDAAFEHLAGVVNLFVTGCRCITDRFLEHIDGARFVQATASTIDRGLYMQILDGHKAKGCQFLFWGELEFKSEFMWDMKPGWG